MDPEIKKIKKKALCSVCGFSTPCTV